MWFADKVTRLAVLGLIGLAVGFSASSLAEEVDDFSLNGGKARYEKLNPLYNVSPPMFNGRYTGAQLGEMLFPGDQQVGFLFRDFEDVETIASSVQPPLSRRERRTGVSDDFAHQRGIQIAVNRGHIRPGTLILSDTGHDIPLAAQLLKNSQLRAQAIFHFPSPLITDSGTYDRLTAQSQEWAQDIAYYQKRNAQAGPPQVLFVGLEGHREGYDDSFLYSIPWVRFPSLKQLKALGIQRLVYMTESHPDNPKLFKDVLEDVKEYLLETGLPIIYLGVDCRREKRC